MGIFGPIDNNKAIEIISSQPVLEEIVNETWSALEAIGSTVSSVNASSGSQILWSIIQKAEKEIPDYIDKAGLNIPAYYPYGDPSKYVACTIIYKYVYADKDYKKDLSRGIEKIKKDGLNGLVQDIVKSYCDNMQKALIKPRPYDKQKETAIKFLADNFEFYDQIFGQRENENNGSPRTRQ